MQKRKYNMARDINQIHNQKLFLSTHGPVATGKDKSLRAPRVHTKKGFTFFGVLILLSFMASASLYVAQINTKIARGGEVDANERRINQLQLEREELRIVQAQSRSRIQESEVIQRYGMEPIVFSQYVDLTDDSRIAADF